MNVNKKTHIRVDAASRRAVGLAFKVARMETGRTQSELAQLLGVSQDAVSSWERGSTGAPVPAIQAVGKLISPTSRKTLFDAAGIEDSEGYLQVKSDTRKIGLLSDPNELGAPNAVAEGVLSLPSEWLPEDANIKAARLSCRISPIFGEELIALVDIRYRDPDRLLGCIVIARTPTGSEPMKLRKDGATYFLVPLRESGDGAVHILRPDGDWSVVGRVTRWIADAPAPARK